jgi:hypothetical protein
VATKPLVPLRVGSADGALRAAIGWLCRSHDVTGRAGSSKGFSLVRGWLPAYPETTGYVIGTLLEYARRAGGAPDLVQRALEMGTWEATVQHPDGGVMEGHVETSPQRSIVFNTGMVLHGWVDLLQAGHRGFEEPAERAARFLVEKLTWDGTWMPESEYAGLPHTYNTRVAWAMLRWARHVDAPDVEDAARLHLDWACTCQRSNGWFENCVFRTGMTPSTHAIAYTLRGLLESYCLAEEEPWLRAVERTSEALLPHIERQPLLCGAFGSDWTPSASHSCLTGTAQLGGVWLRLHQETGDRRWLNAGLKAVEQAAGRQERVRLASVHGALAGSFPIWGKYAPLQYPNWATKFLADALFVYDDCLSASQTGGVESVTPRPRARFLHGSTAQRGG